MLAEHNAATGAPQADYIYGATGLLCVGSGTSLSGNGNATFLICDRLSERASLNKYMGVIGLQYHMPYGEDFGESGSQEKHHFTVYERDAESGQDYALNREYASLMGRFLQPDPVDGSQLDPQSNNRYACALGNPTNSTDPNGLVQSTQALRGSGQLLEARSKTPLRRRSRRIRTG